MRSGRERVGVEAEASAEAGDGAAEHPGLVGNGGGVRCVAVRGLGPPVGHGGKKIAGFCGFWTCFCLGRF